MTATTDGPKGLGGWLILPMIGLFVLPIRMGFSLMNDFLPIFREGYWDILTTPGSEAYHHLWAPVILSEVVGNTLFIVFDIILIFLLFAKSYRFPVLYIIFLGSNLVFVAADFFLAGLIPAVAESNDPESLKELIRSIVGALIWIPYFLLSKRVRNTFVRVQHIEPLQPAAHAGG